MARSYRSGLEERVAKWLELNNHPFEYETQRVAYELECYYKPDFILPNGVILETKGWWPPADRRKILAVIRQNPDLRLYMVFQNPDKTLSRLSKTTYGDWCDKHNIPWCKADSNQLHSLMRQIQS
jgi:hypothetical protein